MGLAVDEHGAAAVTIGTPLKSIILTSLFSPSFFLTAVYSFKTESHITLASLELVMEDQAGYYTLQQVNFFPLLVL